MQSDLEPQAIHQVFMALTSTSADDSSTGKTVSPEPTLNYDSFATFLSSPDNAILSSKNRRIHQDMTKPLPEYYISSSHNTYLLGHQWKGNSTVEGYIRALLAGCRSVECESKTPTSSATPLIYLALLQWTVGTVTMGQSFIMARH